MVLAAAPQPLERDNVDLLSFIGEGSQRFQVQALARDDVGDIHIV